jgi:hypothetical protein
MGLIVLFTLLASAASALFIPSETIPVDSSTGRKLLRHATPVESVHRLLNNDNERDMSYIANHSIKYLGCISYPSLAVYGGNNIKNDGVMYQQNLVRFALCPGAEGDCSSCTGGGEYVVNMNIFVDTYTEYKMEFAEWQCEQIRENCDCQNANDDQVCENTCYAAAGLEDCVEVGGQEEFEVQRYLECAGT